jgi:hypothetical protein
LNCWLIGDYLDSDVATFKITISLVPGSSAVGIGDGVSLGAKSRAVPD